MKHIIVIIITSLLLSACAQHYSVSTNLDKKNFTEYFSPAKVKIYPNEQAFNAKYHYLAAVEGESCQTDSRHEPANEVTARTNTRRNAFELGANAIIFTGCTLIDSAESDKQCITTRVCYGKAYQVEQR
ncbi:exopolysaccharide biosynthesis protein [Thalassotalea insulae]|uniref:Exopolysaccharide biosynthesis protein n=1 Tax=Thalassotalea insulae TaxID=2056778 RepID=A0ABQ6GW63_9GAMM|nr:Rcs stress response system protein RcsF [Thalassotalea insulae]GLX80183.1 exopolysaccharide biosynthesis protein [Thalassotalea insulae]